MTWSLQSYGVSPKGCDSQQHLPQTARSPFVIKLGCPTLDFACMTTLNEHPHTTSDRVLARYAFTQQSLPHRLSNHYTSDLNTHNTNTATTAISHSTKVIDPYHGTHRPARPMCVARHQRACMHVATWRGNHFHSRAPTRPNPALGAIFGIERASPDGGQAPGSILVAVGHTLLNIPDLVRTLKSSTRRAG